MGKTLSDTSDVLVESFQNMWLWILFTSSVFGGNSAKGCMVCQVLQYVALNNSYLFLFCLNIDSELMNNTWFSISLLNLHSYCCPAPSGLIWSRYSLVIIPKNWNLFAVNFFVGSAGATQLYRIWRFVGNLQ